MKFSMRYSIDEPLKFTFHLLNEHGQNKGFFSKWGRFDGSTLKLGKATYSSDQIARIEQRGHRMALVAYTGEGPTVINVGLGSRRQAEELKAALDVLRSRAIADQSLRKMEAEGRAHDHREGGCPECGAIMVLSGLVESPQLYCEYCHRLTTIRSHSEIPPNENAFRICDECDLFSQPKKFKVLYAWFLIFIYGIRIEEKWCCHACMRRESWKMLFGNLIFLIGVPYAIYALIRAYANDVIGSSAFRGLDAGNIKAMKGDIDGALAHYQSILERVPHSAGVKYNLGQGLLKQEDFAHAASAFEAALQDCSNYIPAVGALRRTYLSMGETKKLRELEALWDIQPAVPATAS